MEKRGISPLIATVLLIGFTIALAVIVTNWGLNYVKGTTERTSQQTEHALSCINDLDFEIKEVICPDETTGELGAVVIDNRGDTQIERMTFRIHHGEDDVLPVEAEGVPAFGVQSYEVTGYYYAGTETPADLAGATQVDAIATILDDDRNEIVCSQVIKERRVSC
ncbi:MAG TPA: archaellin/type IV pilin N-terminal domain-containing protein [Candidatus Nanoarchaeia archaeon]|nr:archaellin/type IV pilin N-terminal domain-containing protein [Candidatus Nanoarchaeia archaeon]